MTFSTTPTSCTVTDHANSTATVRFTHVGGCSVAADQAGAADYVAAAQQTQTVTVVRAPTSVSNSSSPRKRYSAPRTWSSRTAAPGA